MKQKEFKSITVIHKDVLSWVTLGTDRSIPMQGVNLNELLDEKVLTQHSEIFSEKR